MVNMILNQLDHTYKFN